LPIIWAIAAKDIQEALRNKLFLSIIVGVGLMVATHAFLPKLFARNEVPTAVVYDQGRSTILRGLTGRKDFTFHLVDSRQEMELAISEAPSVRLGLVAPAEFDQRAGDGAPIELDGYRVHWADPQKIDQWADFFANQLGQVSWGTVRINLGGHVLYPPVESGGQPLMTSVLLVVIIATIGAALVPLLMVEEKETRTLDALLASPASFTQVVSGKLLAGVFYCLAAAVVLFFFYWHLFVSLSAALLAVALSTAFAVALGLLVGVVSDNPTTVGMWGGLLLLGLIILTFLELWSRASWPQVIQTLLAWSPGALMVNLYRFSMAAEVSPARLASSAAALALEAGLIYLLVGGLVRRWERQ
jgi:ABC-type transport system involved in multi-copper enzyme maturation permease subunit